MSILHDEDYLCAGENRENCAPLLSTHITDIGIVDVIQFETLDHARLRPFPDIVAGYFQNLDSKFTLPLEASSKHLFRPFFVDKRCIFFFDPCP